MPVYPGAHNHQHRHSAIGLMTPAAIHQGSAPQLHAERQRVLTAAYTNRPDRFVNQPPTPPDLPTAAWINKPNPTEEPAAHYHDERQIAP
jgi:putative transposase